MSESTALIEALIAVHAAPDTGRLTDAAVTAAERGLGALYAFLFLGESSGPYRVETPASRARAAAEEKLRQVMKEDITLLQVELDRLPVLAEAMEAGGARSFGNLTDVLPLSASAGKLRGAQRKLGVDTIWLSPVADAGERHGFLLLLMPSGATGSLPETGLLGRHIAVALGKLRDAERGRKMGQIDPVRWINDERRFLEQLALEIQRAKRHDRPLSILVLRLSNYDELLRQYGRFLAERLLRRIAGAMEDVIRNTDFLGAFGGDGFAAILVEADGTRGDNAKKRILAALHGLQFPGLEAQSLNVDLSCEVVTLGPDGDAADQLMGRARERLERPTRELRQAS
jgi:diguanylate cyclase (GGDEF)-like protein